MAASVNLLAHKICADYIVKKPVKVVQTQKLVDEFGDSQFSKVGLEVCQFINDPDPTALLVQFIQQAFQVCNETSDSTCVVETEDNTGPAPHAVYADPCPDGISTEDRCTPDIPQADRCQCSSGVALVRSAEDLVKDFALGAFNVHCADPTRILLIIDYMKRFSCKEIGAVEEKEGVNYDTVAIPVGLIVLFSLCFCFKICHARSAKKRAKRDAAKKAASGKHTVMGI
jgi:hypothetical protein